MHIVHTTPMHSLSEMQPSRPAFQRAAFSLVEVALAIAIVSVAVVGILSLMSTGLGSYRQVMDTTICAQIAQRIINDAQQADFRALTDYANTKGQPAGFTFRAPRADEGFVRYFDEQGNEVIPASEEGELTPLERNKVIYWVNTRITPRAGVPRTDGQATKTSFQKPTGLWEANDGGTLVQVTVEVAANPNGIELEYVSEPDSPMDNLFDVSKTPGIRVLTYSAMVGRNE